MTQPNYNLKNVDVLLDNGIVADATSISIARKLQLIERTPGRSKRELATINKEMRPEITIEGFNSDDLSFADLKPGTKIVGFAVNPTAGGDNATFLQSDFLTTWPVSEMYLGRYRYFAGRKRQLEMEDRDFVRHLRLLSR